MTILNLDESKFQIYNQNKSGSMCKNKDILKILAKPVNHQLNKRLQVPLFNFVPLCRQLVFPCYSTDQKQIVNILTGLYSAKWNLIKDDWQSGPLMLNTQRKVNAIAERGRELRWSWNPCDEVRNDPITMSYLCVSLYNKCFYCGKVKVPIGRAREKGADHYDWINRKLHKSCWKKLKSSNLDF